MELSGFCGFTSGWKRFAIITKLHAYIHLYYTYFFHFPEKKVFASFLEQGCSLFCSTHYIATTTTIIIIVSQEKTGNSVRLSLPFLLFAPLSPLPTASVAVFLKEKDLQLPLLEKEAEHKGLS